MSQALRPVTLGLAAGFVGGLLGVGGGTIIVPGLVLWLGFPQRRAHATSIAVIVFATITSATVFASQGRVVWSAVAYIFVGGAAGAFVGARFFIGRISEVWLGRAFVVVLLAAAGRMAFA